jgi:hypothetical protein
MMVTETLTEREARLARIAVWAKTYSTSELLALMALSSDAGAISVLSDEIASRPDFMKFYEAGWE